MQAGYAIYADWAIVSTDGTVTPITLTPTSGPQTPSVNAGTGMPYMDNAGANGPLSAHYFISDHLGTAQLEIAEGGWPVYSGQFAPFGQEMQNGRYLSQTQADGSTSNYKFTGKERDAESGLDYFGARYYASGMGRFMSTDPVVITPERQSNPQQLNLYAYVANNPLRYIDPTGKVLVATGNTQADYKDLCAIAGDACARRLAIDPKTGNVTFNTGALDENTPALDLSKNEGAALVNDLVTSKNTYEFSEGPTVMTANGPRKFDFITNLPSFGDQPSGGQPRAGVSDVIALNFKNLTFHSYTNLGVAPQFTQAFHELAEAYAKIDGGKGGSYPEGHTAAIQRENRLRDQRPYLKQYNDGSGGPDLNHPSGEVIIKQ